MKRKTLWPLVMLAFPGLLWAQKTENTSLSQLYESASSYPGLHAKTEAVEAAAMTQKITKRDYFPDIQLQAQNTYSTYEGTSGAFIPLPGLVNVSGKGPSGDNVVNTMLSATVQWDFLKFGEHTDEVEITELNTAKAETDYDVEMLKLHHRITEAYLSWLNSQYMKDWAERETERNSDLFKLSKNLVTNGLTPAADSLLAKSTLKQTSSKESKWKARVQQFSNKIKELTDLHPVENDLSDSFLSTTDEEVGLEDSPEEHPLLTEKDQEEEQLGIRAKNATHKSLPNLSVLAGGLLRGESYRDEGESWGETYKLPAKNYLVGLGLTWKIDEFFTQGPEKKKYKHKQNQAAEEHKATERFLHEEEESLRVHINEALAEIEDVEQAYSAAKTSYDQFKVRYEKGLIDLASLLQTKQTLQYAEKSRIKAYFEYWKYWNDYAFATADFLPLTAVFN